MRFESSIKEFKDTVEKYNAVERTDTDNNQRYKIVIIDDNGKEQTKSFEKAEYGNRAKLLYRDITAAIEEMGQSITEQEKRQVLMDILAELC